MVQGPSHARSARRRPVWGRPTPPNDGVGRHGRDRPGREQPAHRARRATRGRAARPPARRECRGRYLDEVLPTLAAGPFLRPGVFLREALGGFLGAELAFAVVGGRRGFGLFPPPGPMYWSSELAALDVACPSKPVCHWIGPIARPAFATLLADTERRRAAADIPGVGGRHWRDEDARFRAGPAAGPE